jgi:hypothetical protein
LSHNNPIVALAVRRKFLSHASGRLATKEIADVVGHPHQMLGATMLHPILLWTAGHDLPFSSTNTSAQRNEPRGVLSVSG